MRSWYLTFSSFLHISYLKLKIWNKLQMVVFSVCGKLCYKEAVIYELFPFQGSLLVEIFFFDFSSFFSSVILFNSWILSNCQLTRKLNVNIPHFQITKWFCLFIAFPYSLIQLHLWPKAESTRGIPWREYGFLGQTDLRGWNYMYVSSLSQLLRSMFVL